MQTRCSQSAPSPRRDPRARSLRTTTVTHGHAAINATDGSSTTCRLPHDGDQPLHRPDCRALRWVSAVFADAVDLRPGTLPPGPFGPPRLSLHFSFQTVTNQRGDDFRRKILWDIVAVSSAPCVARSRRKPGSCAVSSGRPHMCLRSLPGLLLCGLSAVLTIMCGSVAQAQDIERLFAPLAAPWLSQGTPGEPEREEEDLETDRDSFTPSTSTVGTGRVVLEAAYSFMDHRRSDDAHSLPEMLTRIGLSERTELRLGWNYEAGGGSSVSGGHGGGSVQASAEEESQMLYGLKVALTEQETWIPESACILQGRTPTSGPETASEFQVGYVFGWEIFSDWLLDSSLRYVTTEEEGDQFSEWAPSVVVKAPLGESWNVHAEYFGIFSDGRAEDHAPQYFSPGVHHLISPDFEIGVRGGWGLNQDAANSFVNAGIGLRF